jgi:hypothetical protein
LGLVLVEIATVIRDIRLSEAVPRNGNRIGLAKANAETSEGDEFRIYQAMHGSQPNWKDPRKGVTQMRFGFKLLKTVAIAAVVGMAGYANAQSPQLFANQYTQGGANQTTAAMYVSPVPVPPWVGHTYYTYEPLYPHEFMHLHNHRYHSYYDGGRGLNRTGVHYYVPPVRTGLHYTKNKLSLPR